MSRAHQFIRSVGLSWVATFATIVYSLLSVPIALRFLTVEEFGLFILLLQVAGFFSLIEMGMSSATARILVDYKDARDGGSYGSVIITGFWFFAVQAFIVFFIGILAAPWIISVIGVPETLDEVATFLLRWLAATSSLVMAFRIYTSILYANMRLDLIHAFTACSVLWGLAVLATILTMGGGLAGLVWLFVAQTAVALILPFSACWKLGLLPRRGHWGKPSMDRFRELFAFGKDVFLVNVGNQVLEASQLIIVTRTMGLTAAAVWSVSTKLFGLVYQFVTKIEGTAIVFFAEMMVRGEKDKLAVRFQQIYQLTAGASVVALAVAVAINPLFVSAWASPSLAWSFSLSVLIAASVFFNTVLRCSGDLIVHTKNIAAFRYVYFLEAVVFVVLALWLGKQLGFYGVVGVSLLCLLVFRATYTTWRMAKYFKLPATVFWFTWLKRQILAALILLPFVLSAGWIANSVPGSWLQLLVAGVWVGLPAAIVFFALALPPELKQDFALRWPQVGLLGKR